MQLITIKIEKPETANFIFGQTYFVKTVEDEAEVAWRKNLLRQIGYKQ